MSHQPHSPAKAGLRNLSLITVVFIILTLGALTTLAVSAPSWFWIDPSAASSAPVTQDAPMEATLLTITPDGFDPQEIMRPAARFILSLENHSGMEQLTLRLAQEGGDATLVREIIMTREQMKWSDELELQPGTYLLTETGNPAWLCRLTITAP